MTLELFRVEPYRATFEAQIVEVGDDYLVLDQTCFFPRSAEQASDTGQIDGVPINGVRRVGREIQHEVLTARGIAVGDRVDCSINWSRRYRIMRLHTAQHLLHIAYRATHGAGTPVGGSVGPRRATLEIINENEAMQIELDALQGWVDGSVRDGLRVIHECDHSLDRRRFWHIDGIASLPCDGTHVRSTTEVGAIEIGVRNSVHGIIKLHAQLEAD